MRHTLTQRAFSNAYLLLTLTALFWAGNFVLARGVHGHVPPIALAFTRWVFASLIVLPFAWPHLRKDWAVIRQHWAILAFLGVVGVSAFNTFAYIGLNHTTAINGVIMQSSGPIMIVLACYLIFGDRMHRLQVLGVAVSLIGVLAVVARGDPTLLTSFRLNQGDVWVLAALATWAIYTAFLRKRPPMHGLSFVAVTFFVGAVVNFPLFVFEHLSGWQLQADSKTLLAILYVSIFPSIVAYIFFNRGVDLIGPQRTGVFLHLVPMFGSLLAIVVLGEQPQLYHAIGFAMILAGVSLAARSPRPSQIAPPE